MIQKFMQWIGLQAPINVRRAHKAYRLKIGKPVILHSAHEREQLEGDYEEIYGATPILREHPHPALGPDESVVSLQSEIRLHW